jgi:hypothetical protein
MRALIKLFLSLILLGFTALIVAAWFALQDKPLVTRQVSLTPAEVARAHAVLSRNDPRRLAPGNNRIVELDARDLDLVANYLLERVAGGAAHLRLTHDRLDIAATVPVRYLPRRKHLNIDCSLVTVDGQPRVSELRIGRLRVPAAIADRMAKQLVQRLYPTTHRDAAAGPVTRLDFLPDVLRLSNRVNPEVIEQSRTPRLTGSDREALRFYHDRLIELQSKGIGSRGALVDLLEPLFAAASMRSIDSDPIQENVALLTVLGTWASGRGLATLLPDRTRQPGGFWLKLSGRRDFARHFLASAALAARGDSQLSDAVGLFKEMSDTYRGSGFSFTDLAADRAGTRFGELASRSPESARRLQRRLAAGVADGDLMPPADDLPEHLRGNAFQQRFDYIGSPAYREMMQEIERRIDACGLYLEP